MVGHPCSRVTRSSSERRAPPYCNFTQRSKIKTQLVFLLVRHRRFLSMIGSTPVQSCPQIFPFPSRILLIRTKSFLLSGPSLFLARAIFLKTNNPVDKLRDSNFITSCLGKSMYSSRAYRSFSTIHQSQGNCVADKITILITSPSCTSNFQTTCKTFANSTNCNHRLR